MVKVGYGKSGSWQDYNATKVTTRGRIEDEKVAIKRWTRWVWWLINKINNEKNEGIKNEDGWRGTCPKGIEENSWLI